MSLSMSGTGIRHTPAGQIWENAVISAAIREFVYRGGGFIGVGEPAGTPVAGTLSSSLLIYLVWKKKPDLTLNYDKYNWEEHKEHFILKDTDGTVDFGEGKKNIFALPDTKILIQKDTGSPDGSKNLRKRQRCLHQRTSVQLLQQPYPLSCCALVSSGRK